MVHLLPTIAGIGMKRGKGEGIWLGLIAFACQSVLKSDTWRARYRAVEKKQRPYSNKQDEELGNKEKCKPRPRKITAEDRSIARSDGKRGGRKGKRRHLPSYLPTFI